MLGFAALASWVLAYFIRSAKARCQARYGDVKPQHSPRLASARLDKEKNATAENATTTRETKRYFLRARGCAASYACAKC